MSRVAALTDHTFTPSSRFRVRQHIAQLRRYGLEITDYPRKYSTETASHFFPDKRIRRHLPKLALAAAMEAFNVAHSFCRVLKARNFDATWLSRELVIRYPTFERLLSRPLFYDLDDAVFLHRGSALGVRRICEAATAVFAGNEYLADYCKQYNQRVYVVPTAVDTLRFAPRPRTARDVFTVGWSGTSSSFKYFLPMQSVLASFFEAHPSSVLKICADRFPLELPDLHRWLAFEQWSPENEVDQIRSFDVGLMPLENSEWAKGKCSYKFLLYAACGVPTICSSIGMNKEVLRLGSVGLGVDVPHEWAEALAFCFDNRDNLSYFFPDCRKVAVEHFSADVVAKRLARAMIAGMQPA